MGLWLLANTAGAEAADLRLASDVTVDVTSTEGAKLDNVRGGPRCMKFKKTASASRRIVYMNKSGLTKPTHIVITDASELIGEKVHLFEWIEYGTNFEVPFSPAPAFNETLVGIEGTDFCRKITLIGESLEALEVYFETTSELTIGKVYFSTGLEFTKASQPTFSKVPVWAPAEMHGQHAYKLHGTARIMLQNVSREMLADYYAMPKDDPIFLYDDTGGSTYGNRIPEKLWHCIILSEQVQQQFDDLYAIVLELGILKHGSGGW